MASLHPALHPGDLVLASQTLAFPFFSFAEAPPPPGSCSHASCSCLSHQGSAACLAAWVTAHLGFHSFTSVPLPSSFSCLCSLNFSYRTVQSRIFRKWKASLPTPTSVPITTRHSETGGSSQEVDLVGRYCEQYWQCLMTSSQVQRSLSTSCFSPSLCCLLETYRTMQRDLVNILF